MAREQHLQGSAEHQEWDAVSDCRAGGIRQAGNEWRGGQALGSPMVVFRGAGDTILFASSNLVAMWGRAGEQFAQEETGTGAG